MSDEKRKALLAEYLLATTPIVGVSFGEIVIRIIKDLQEMEALVEKDNE